MQSTLLVTLENDGLTDDDGAPTDAFTAVCASLEFSEIPANVRELDGVSSAAKARNALILLQLARDLLESAKCPRAAARVRLAISSAKGAARNAHARGSRKAVAQVPA